MITPQNLLIIMSDEHRRDAMGCAGHSIVQTPHLDQLAERGTLFSSAYTPCPMCVPTRASIHTGRYVHQIGTWDSAHPYEGQAESWTHRVREAGHHVSSIGKLHFRASSSRNGFSEEIHPLHVLDGVGWTLGLLRDELPPYERGTRELAEQVGAGETSYTQYDRRLTTEAKRWLFDHTDDDKPWVLFLSYLSPHYPLIAPEEFYNLYAGQSLDEPIPTDIQQLRQNPALAEFLDFYNYRDHFDEERAHMARAAYYGLCTFLDANIGQVLSALQASGQAERTQVIYTSDHGELLGDHGMWTKMSMYESSVGVPLIMTGEGVPAGYTTTTPVNLIDLYPTVLESVGIPPHPDDADLPGRSLIQTANQPDTNRLAFSEYHDGGCTNSFYMVREGDWKLIHYVNNPPQLFNLANNPDETLDLASRPGSQPILHHLTNQLRTILDPEAVSAQAHADQARRVAELGGREAILASGGDFGFTPISH